MRQFRRSSWFGIVGVFVVAGLCAFVALQYGQGEANPKDAYALIFGILAVFLVLLFFFQSRDLSKAEAADATGSKVAPESIKNPAMVEDSALWAALAIRPIDAEAVKARKASWGMARQSIRLGMLITLLIFLSVPPIYLFGTFVPLMIGVPLIAGIALWKSARLLAGGGDLDKAYEATGRAMAPLGLAVTEHPEVAIEPKGVAPFRMGATVRGSLILEGKRHGRAVRVRMPTGEGLRTKSDVQVSTQAPAFEFKARDGRLKAKDGTPEAMREALARVPNSTRWNGVSGEAQNGSIVVERKGHNTGGDWLLDLWLAERLADAVPRR